MSTVTATWRGDYRVDVQARTFGFRVDQPPDFKGEDTGLMPTEALLASLAACVCQAIVYLGRKSGIELPDLVVTASGKKDYANFLFPEMEISVESSLEREQLERLVEDSKRVCFVSNTLTKGCPIQVRISGRS